MQNEARFEFVLIDGTGASPSEGGTPSPDTLGETNRLLRKILEQQGFQRVGGDGASTPTVPAPSADSLAEQSIPTPQVSPLPTAPTVADRLEETTPPPRLDPRPDRQPVELPQPRVTTPEQRTVDPVTVQPAPQEIATPSIAPPTTSVAPPSDTPSRRPAQQTEGGESARVDVPRPPGASPTIPPSPAEPDSLEERARKFNLETEEMGRKLIDDLFGHRRRRNSESEIINAELVPVSKPEPPPEPTEIDSLEERARKFNAETEEMGRKLREELFGSRRRRTNVDDIESGPPVVQPIDPRSYQPVDPPAPPAADIPFVVPKSIPAIGGAAVGVPVAAVAAGSVVAAGAIGVAAIAKANYELIQSVDKLARQLAPELANYSPEVAAATAQAELRRTMRAFSTSERLGPDVARLVEANSRLGDAMVAIRDVIAGPLMKDAATIKEGIAGAAEVISGFFERNQKGFDIAYELLTRYIPGPQNMIGQGATAMEILKRMTGYESNQSSFESIFMGDGMLTPPGWNDATEVDVNPVFADPVLGAP